MKTLFCGPLLDMSGFAAAARIMLRTLLAGNIDIVARALKYDVADSGSEYNPESWLKPLLNKPLLDINLVIQCTTPNIEAVPISGLCNGIYTFIETDRIPMHWVEKLNQFDFIIVSSRYNATTMVNNGITKPIICVPVPFDMEKVRTAPSNRSMIGDIGNRTVFYNICQLSAKKGIDALIRAYYAAFFDKPDDVLLVLKTYINMANRQNEREIIKQFIDKIRHGCRLPVQKYPPIQVITQTLTDEQIQQLHKQCHAYVNSSRAEGYCLPAFDAMAHGNLLISNNFGGMADYVKPETALIYGGCLSNCYEMPCGDPLQYTGIARWFEPSTAEMADLMRAYHELRIMALNNSLDIENAKKWEAINIRKDNGRIIAQRHDYKIVADQIVEQIYSAFNSWKVNGRVIFNTTVPNVPPMERTNVLV